jgi:hypothetical protein
MSIKAGRPVAAGALDNRRSIPRTMVTTFRHHFAELPDGAKRRSIIPALCSGADHRPWLGRQRQTSTEAALDALRDRHEVDPVVDAVGGTSPEAHRTA